MIGIGTNIKSDDIKFLSTSPWIHPYLLEYDNSSTKILKNYLYLSEEKFFKKRTYILTVGDVFDKCYYIKKGIILCSMVNKNGLEKVTHIVGSGCLLGEEAIFHNQPIIINVQAITDVEVYAFSKKVILDLINNNSEISLMIIKALALKTRMLATQVEDLSFRTTLEKVCRILYCFSIYEDQYKEPNNSLRLSHQDLAHMVGAHRVSVSNALSELRKDDIIDYYDGNLLLKDKSKLRKIAFSN